MTDIDLVREYCRHIEAQLGEAIRPERIDSSLLKEIAGEFFSWKETWKFRSADVNRLGKYYFDGSQYMISRIDYAALGSDGSKYDKIFVSLTSHFGSPDELLEAEYMLQSNIRRFVVAYQLGA